MIRILRQGLPVIGHAKIGMEGTPRDNRRAEPVKFDHLEITTTRRDREGRLELDEPLMKRLVDAGLPTCGGCDRSKKLGFAGGLPRALDVYLPTNSVDHNIPNRLVWYRGRFAMCTGDGEVAQRRPVIEEKPISTSRGERTIPILGEAKPHQPCGAACPEFRTRKCRPQGRFYFALPQQEQVGGVYVFRTTSWASIANLVEGMTALQRATGGILQWIRFRFAIVQERRQPQNAEAPPAAHWVATLTYPGRQIELLEELRQMLELRAPLIAEIRRQEGIVQSWDEPDEEEARAREAEFPVGAEPEVQVEDAPAPAPAPGVSEPATALDEEVVAEPRMVEQVYTQAKRRGAQLKLPEDGWMTLLSDVMRAVGLEDSMPEQLPRRLVNDVLKRIREYQLPS